MRFAFYGSSLVSAYWNGAATYYRGILKALAARGHAIRFFEPDAFDRQAHRDIEPPDWAEVVVYEASPAGVAAALEAGAGADVLVKASGVGVFDDALAAGVLASRRPGALTLFWDVDAPATLAELGDASTTTLRALVPEFDAIFTYGGGPAIEQRYRRLGARSCWSIYNAVDPEEHHPVPAEPALATDLLFLGNRLPDRETRVERFFLEVAAAAPELRFTLGGSGWADKPVPVNVAKLGHVSTRDHNRLNCSARAVLNVSRKDMAAAGFAPATRVFEAAGAGACLITDAWPGIEQFLTPGREVLVATDGAAVLAHLRALDPATSQRLGAAARARVLRDHSYASRALAIEAALAALRAPAPLAAAALA